MVAKKPKIQVYAQPSDYFQELITQAAQDTQKSSRKESVQYLASLLNDFLKARTEALNLSTFDNLTPSLALMEAGALATGNQFRLYKKIGDVSLFVSGLFLNALARSMLDLDYYKTIGEKGYHLAHTVSAEQTLKETFLDLSLNFLSYIEILHHVSTVIGLSGNKNLLYIYDQWIKTQSEFFERILRARGFDLQQMSKFKT